MHLRHALLALSVAAAGALPAAVPAQTSGAAALGQLIEGLPVTVRVLVIGAHPDDEDTRLITWLIHGHHADVAYLSLTRGDGGQNLIGDELGEALGVIRTEELLAARRIDGAHQYFTRAYDFGFSKTAAESFSHWPHEEVLRDVVTVVRAFRPQIIVSVFSGTPRDGHGQHQVAGIVAREAFDAATDTVRFPRAATAGFGAWTPLKFYRSESYWRGQGATLTYNAGGYDPLLGETYAELAAESRSQHKSQGFGAIVPQKGSVTGSVRREASRVAAPADPTKERSLFDGVDTTWHRLDALVAHPSERALLDRLQRATNDAVRTLRLEHPATGVPALERARAALAALERAERSAPHENRDVATSLASGMRRITRALLLARGIAIQARAPRDAVAQGDSLPVAVTVYDQGGAPVTARVLGAGTGPLPLAMGSGGARSGGFVRILPDSAHTDTVWVHGGALTQPWWLTAPRRGDMFTVPLDGESDDVRDAGIQARVALDDGQLETAVPIEHLVADPVRGEALHPLQVVPVIAVTLDRTVAYAPANTPISRTVRVHLVSAATAPRGVAVHLRLPAGLAADSAERHVTLGEYGATATVDFTVHGTVAPGEREIAADASSDGTAYRVGYIHIDHPHIRPQNIYRDAAERLAVVDVALPPRLDVGYVRGVGDNVAPMLRELGVPLTMLDPAQLGTADLSRFTTIVVGTRAYEAHPELVAANPRLLDWVRHGGTLVVQYGQYEMARPGIMPYPITLARPAARVTDEDAAVTVLDTASALLRWPNRIGPADWTGWVQERSLYMPGTFDPHYHAVVSMHDAGEPPNDAAILVTPYGSGTYVYTTLSLFRQLPAGNPGGARLFVNLMGAGRENQGAGSRDRGAGR